MRGATEFLNNCALIGSARFVLNLAFMAGVKDHEELDAWKLSDELRVLVDRVTDSAFRHHPRLREQLQTAANSACPNLAEGFSRYYPHDHARFVRIAKGSLSETLDRLKVAVRKGLVEPADASRIESLARRARGACTGLIRYLDSGVQPPRR